ncbi:DUF4249 domain-containing protein [Salibacter halophilus]|uniref:DUF4249 domain-containing protein n=1 Tax=Salibacter halophilus TaxID=1803916 RepID=A0A6N6M7L0_9FLAO|nr:DUF4249 domain-containing protein [Salibacter halophilus]KAB1064731.1 DUF4249 domain-containing protein [Salibacter halophilus]
MMKNLSIIFAVLTIGFTSCTDVVDLDIDEKEDALVVDGRVLTSDSVQTIRLSRTTDYFNPQFPDYEAEKNATIRFYENETYIGNFVFNDSTNRFEIAHPAFVGNSYHIEIETESGESYRSEPETIREVSDVDSIYYKKEQLTDFFDSTYSVYINAQELPGEGDNYQWKVYLNGAYQNQPDDLTFFNDDFVDDEYIEEALMYVLDEDEFNQRANANNEVEVYIEQLGITPSYYDFLFQLSQQSSSGGPFAAPPAQIVGNIIKENTDGQRALGYFYAADIDVSDTIAIRK